MFNLDKEQNKFFREYKTSTGTFKLREGKNDPTIFLPLNTNIVGQTTSYKIKYNENKYLTEDQARHVYKKIESGNIININTLKQEIEQDQQLNKLDDTSGDINPYRELKVYNAEKIETDWSQMEQWSIFSNVVSYIQYNRHPKNFHNWNIRAVNKEKYKKFKYRCLRCYLPFAEERLMLWVHSSSEQICQIDVRLYIYFP